MLPKGRKHELSTVRERQWHRIAAVHSKIILFRSLHHTVNPSPASLWK